MRCLSLFLQNGFVKLEILMDYTSRKLYKLTQPIHIMIVRTYEELRFFVEMFKNGNCDLLIIESLGGYGKSSLVEEVMQDIRYLKILAHVTPMQLFILSYKFKNLPIVVDDVDCLLYNEQTVSLLKMLAETRETKEIAWFTTHKLLAEQEIPQKFETKSRIIVLTNDFHTVTKKIAALRDRGFYIVFKPTNEELLRKISEIKESYENGLTSKEKQEVYSLIEKYSKFCDISLRTLVKGLMLYKECNNGKHLNWREKLLKEMNISPKLILVDELMTNYKEDKERIPIWEQKYSKRSFYDYKLKVMQKCSEF